MDYANYDIKKLKEIYNEIKIEYNNIKSKNILLDISRGKPCKEQLDLSNNLLKLEMKIDNLPLDLRNYGVLDGLDCMKRIFAEILDVEMENIFIGGNSSLCLMVDIISTFMLSGDMGLNPWSKQDKIKFLCPVPGYDRHFSICENLNIEMIPIPMDNNGPDMDIVEELIKDDDSVKGIWNVPIYSNPTGIVYSKKVIERFARLIPKAKDFKVFWDQAYALHTLTNEFIEKDNILKLFKNYNNENMIYIFSSTSKITFAGSGISCIASSIKNIEFIKKIMSIKTIGNDKLNQFRHIKFLKNLDYIKSHMIDHKEILKPKFDLVIKKLNNLKDIGIIDFREPKGGYFISVDTIKGNAEEIINICKQLGLILTPAGSTYPYRKDLDDKNIRIAPTYLNINELDIAMDIFILSVKYVSLKKLINI
ncbi:MAG: aminotransferase class I/II-fold pyridoxal phosphate-dependent enzyme [Oscillospiraceae bacterium]|nr:aminotransferase class I/II-fold pyridoxal phosphate-dependent enzyme [Oscillospiraceae bacterium]